MLGACSKAPESESVPVAEDSPRRPVAIPVFPDIASLSELIASGESTSTALLEDSLAKTRKFAHLQAFISVDDEGASTRAKELDRLQADGELLGPLHGIPIVVKDNIHVAGLQNTAGTPGLKGFVPSSSNEVVTRLEAAGAIIVGKTNLHELAFGITSENFGFGAVKNPYDDSLIPGGSSGGTAAAVSAGIVAAGLGTDTGGSVRIPPALTGIVGFRPSMGRYPSDAVTPISHTRDTIGLLSRTVDDLIVLDSVIVATKEAVEPIPAERIRLGVPRGYFYQNMDSETATVINETLAQLEAANVQLVEADIPEIEELITASAFPIALYEVLRDLTAYLAEYNTGVSFAELTESASSPDVKGVLDLVSGDGATSDKVYASALAAREQLRRNYDDYFAKHHLDAIIFPTTLLPARPIEGSIESVELNGVQVPTLPTYIHNTDPASIAALPGISLPVGLTASGLPVGMEIDGPEQSDRRLLAVARSLEQIIGFKERPAMDD
jgi:mandelamide amidase